MKNNFFNFVYLLLIVTTSSYSQCWQKFDAGDSHVLAIANDGSLWAWGNNTYGKLGIGNFGSQNTPQSVISNLTWSEVSAGVSHSLGIKSDGTLWAWGRNNSYQLGIGSVPSSQLLPVQVGTENNWQKVFAGNETSFAIKTDGTLWAWGKNNLGQIGNGGSSVVSNPVQIGTSNNWQTIASGIGDNGFTIGLKQDGTLWSWGHNVVGQLGLGDYNDRNIPTQVGTLNNWIKIAASRGTSLAINSVGELYYFGVRLGDTSSSYVFTPTLLNNETDWKDISAGLYHATALKINNSLWGWGSDTNYQLGPSQSGDYEQLPVLINDTMSWSSISNGGLSSSGLTNDGKIYGFGFNFHGIIGNGTNNDTSTISQANCPSTLVVNNDFNSLEFKLYPNPVTDYVVIESTSEIKSIELLDILGKRIHLKSSIDSDVNKTITIDLSEIPSGYYLIHIEDVFGGIKVFKILKR